MSDDGLTSLIGSRRNPKFKRDCEISATECLNVAIRDYVDAVTHWYDGEDFTGRAVLSDLEFCLRAVSSRGGTLRISRRKGILEKNYLKRDLNRDECD